MITMHLEGCLKSKRMGRCKPGMGMILFGKRTWKEESGERNYTYHMNWEARSGLRTVPETLRRVMDTDSLERPVSEHRRYIE